MYNMASKDILPAVSAYSGKLAESAVYKKQLSDAIDCSYEEIGLTNRIRRLSYLEI